MGKRDYTIAHNCVKGDKQKATFAYEVYFLSSTDDLYQLALYPGLYCPPRKTYTYLSNIACEAGDIAIVTSKVGQSITLGLVQVVRQVELGIALLDERVSNPNTGFLIGRSPYTTELKVRVSNAVEMEDEKLRLRQAINKEREKIMLNQLVAMNPELAQRIAEFRARYPEEPIVAGDE